MRFEGAVLTSVVPQITGALAECARHYTGRKPVIVSPEIRTGLTMGVDEPTPWVRIALWMRLMRRQIFRCRWSRWILALPRPLMWWTRTACSGRCHLPGAFHRAAGTGRPLCPAAAGASWLAQKRHWHQHRKCMLSGSVMGTAVLIDGMVQRIEEELGRPATLVVTGGLAKYVTPLCRHPLTYYPELLMKGLALCTSSMRPSRSTTVRAAAGTMADRTSTAMQNSAPTPKAHPPRAGSAGRLTNDRMGRKIR